MPHCGHCREGSPQGLIVEKQTFEDAVPGLIVEPIETLRALRF
jgi:hypothetical protein